MMKTCKPLSTGGQCVGSHLVSVHMCQAFDDLLLLKRGGHPTYVGPLGTHSVNLINYFEVRELLCCSVAVLEHRSLPEDSQLYVLKSC